MSNFILLLYQVKNSGNVIRTDQPHINHKPCCPVIHTGSLRKYFLICEFVVQWFIYAFDGHFPNALRSQPVDAILVSLCTSHDALQSRFNVNCFY